MFELRNIDAGWHDKNGERVILYYVEDTTTRKVLTKDGKWWDRFHYPTHINQPSDVAFFYNSKAAIDFAEIHAPKPKVNNLKTGDKFKFPHWNGMCTVVGKMYMAHIKCWVVVYRDIDGVLNWVRTDDEGEIEVDDIPF